MILSNLNFTSCDELRLHGVTIPAYFNILGKMQYCTSWSKLLIYVFMHVEVNLWHISYNMFLYAFVMNIALEFLLTQPSLVITTESL